MIDEGIVVEKDVSTDIIAMWQSIITWYGGLSTTFQFCLWLLLTISIIGFFRLLYLIYREWHADPRLINNYIENVISFTDKYQNGQKNSVEVIYLLRKSEQVSKLLNESLLDSPVSELAARVKFSNLPSFHAIDSLRRRIIANCLKWDENCKTTKWLLVGQLLLPIVFWPFRGIEVLLQLLSYLLKIIGVDSFNSKGKLALAIASIGGVVGFLGSLASILSIFGVSFADRG